MSWCRNYITYNFKIMRHTECDGEKIVIKINVVVKNNFSKRRKNNMKLRYVWCIVYTVHTVHDVRTFIWKMEKKKETPEKSKGECRLLNKEKLYISICININS